MSFPPPTTIRKAAVIGAGTMGAQIALHLANSGLPVVLLDQPNTKDPSKRNENTDTLFQRALKLNPKPYFTAESIKRISLGNVEDDLSKLKEVDWVVESVFEKLDIKQSIHQRIAENVCKDAIVTTNTSGIPLREIARVLPHDRKKRFFGSHFFNPPRYMQLVELISIQETDPQVLASFTAFAEAHLGKEVVPCYDVPGFISNRIGYFALQHAIWLTKNHDLTIAEVDSWTGPLIGRPKSATFRLADVIGIDVVAHIGKNLLESLPNDDGRSCFEQPDFVVQMLERGWTGQKSGTGFYRKVKTDKGGEILALDLHSLKHTISRSAGEFSSLPRDLNSRLPEIFKGTDKASRFIWEHLSEVLCYSANHVQEVTDKIINVDRVMRRGFNWEAGPFEIWDILGVKNIVNRLENEGRILPPLIQQLLKKGVDQFYTATKDQTFYLDLKSFKAIRSDPSKFEVKLNLIRKSKAPVFANSGGELLDLGDGILCAEFQSKMNAIGTDQLDLMSRARDEATKGFSAIVFANEATHFSAGANLKLFVEYIEQKKWSELGDYMRGFQHTFYSMYQTDKPILAACHGYTLGAGCEVTLAADFVIAHAETYMGLPESKVGLIPGACGCVELLNRWTAGIKDPEALLNGALSAWKTIFSGNITQCAEEAYQSRLLLKNRSAIVFNRDWTIGVAREKALEFKGTATLKKHPGTLPATGQQGLNRIHALLDEMVSAEKISADQRNVGEKLAGVITGGNGLKIEWKEPGHFLDLERETILSLLSEPTTLEKIKRIL